MVQPARLRVVRDSLPAQQRPVLVVIRLPKETLAEGPERSCFLRVTQQVAPRLWAQAQMQAAAKARNSIGP